MELSSDSPQKVCFFDSGIGGLTLLYECAKRLPQTKLYYFADNKNVPYGDLPQDELKKKVERIFSGISALKPAAAVVACNTVTARCIKSLRADYSFPIVGIQPAVKEAVKTGGKCVVFATPATATSSSLKKLIDAYGNAQTEVVACPKFAAFVERNIFNLDEEELINLLPDVTADAVVLGCTHYIYVKKTVEKKYSCPVFTGLEGTANRLMRILGATEGGLQPPNIQNVTFVGGDEEKNRRVFFEVLCGLT